ncbi:ATP-binding protein [Candidatus Saccharibacteria bacterium]|nr:ATP-binding protein [Candidatus Saccharibacteria bacterium]
MDLTYIKREHYLEKLRALKDEHIIKVVTGVRRCGKSVLLETFRDELLRKKVKRRQITYLNFEDPENTDILDWREVYQRINDNLLSDQMNYIFLDEVQNIPEFERMVDGLFVKKNVDLYITGSNAYFLSSEIATILSGRYIEIRVLPYSFSEYKEARMLGVEKAYTDEALFEEYVNYGSFPQVADFIRENKQRLINDYLTGIMNTVMIKDVNSRTSTTSPRTATNIMRFMLGNIGNLVSPNNIADTMTADHQAVSRPTVANYLAALSESFLLYPVERFDIRGKKLLRNYGKYYTVDLGLRRTVLGNSFNTDRGMMLENLVYLELLRRGNTVRIGRAGEQEVDFIAIDENGDTSYYQVAYTVREEKTLERELASLRQINDNNPKYLITMDVEKRDYDGIRQVNALDFFQ